MTERHKAAEEEALKDDKMMITLLPLRAWQMRLQVISSEGLTKKKRRFADYKQICREKWAEGERERVFEVLLLLLSSA